MKRKIIQMGGRTQSVTLPQRWVKKFDLNKGDHLDVNERGDELILKTRNRESKAVEIDLTGMNKSLITESITAHYKFGYDKLVLKFDPTTYDLWEEKEVDIRKVLQDQCDELIGFECINLTRKGAMVHDIMGVSAEDFDSILRRIFLLLRSYSKDVHKGITEHNTELLDFVSDQSKSMRKYSRYCMRYLSKVGKSDDTSKYLYLISSLDQARVSLRFVIKMHKNTTIKENYSKTGLEVIHGVADMFDEINSLFCKFSMEKANEVFRKRAKLIKKCYKLASSKNRADSVISQRLVQALNTVWDIALVCIALNVEGKK